MKYLLKPLTSYTAVSIKLVLMVPTDDLRDHALSKIRKLHGGYTQTRLPVRLENLLASFPYSKADD